MFNFVETYANVSVGMQQSYSCNRGLLLKLKAMPSG